MYVGPPLKPNVIVTEITLESFSIAWDAFSHDACGSTVYSVRLWDEMQLIADNITTDDHIKFTGLSNSTGYEVSLFATNNAGPGSNISVNVMTLTPAGNASFIISSYICTL